EQILTRLQHPWEETEELLGLKSDWDKERERLVRQTEVERPLVVSKCEGLHQFLAEQERLLLARLGELDEEIGRRREENATHLGEEISRLSALMTELEGKRQQPVLELLQGVRSAVSRDEKAMSPHLVPESPELEKRILDFPRENNLQEAVMGFLGLTRGYAEVGTLSLCLAEPPSLPLPLLLGWQAQSMPGPMRRFINDLEDGVDFPSGWNLTMEHTSRQKSSKASQTPYRFLETPYTLETASQYTKDSQPLPLDSPIHSLQPGDSVRVRTWKDEPLQEKWKGPYTVLLVSHMAAKVEGHKNWIHYTRLKAVSTPPG
ncbi:unnamed protein product, partial [Eretmochelys imbricata]